MTDTAMTAPHPDLRPDAKPYVPPALVTFGDVRALTAGPNFGALDQLVGSSGGFLPADQGSIDVARPE